MILKEKGKMSINVDGVSVSTAVTAPDMHLLPCRIEYDGPAKVDEYFLSNVQESTTGRQYLDQWSVTILCLSINRPK